MLLLTESNQGLKLKVLMISTICWNARSINTQGVLERLQRLKNFHGIFMIAILEPFSDNS